MNTESGERIQHLEEGIIKDDKRTEKRDCK